MLDWPVNKPENVTSDQWMRAVAVLAAASYRTHTKSALESAEYIYNYIKNGK